jgi:hypothetical protein
VLLAGLSFVPYHPDSFALLCVQVGILSQEEFPPGPLYFKNDTWREAHGHRSKLVHNNWVIGHDVKKQRFVDRNLWFATDFDEFGEISKRSDQPGPKGQVAQGAGGQVAPQ